MNTWIAGNDLMKHHYQIKTAFYSELNLEDITDKDYAHAQKVFEELNLKNIGDYHDLYVQSDTLLLADVFENFRNECIKIYEHDPAHFLSAPGLGWPACLKKAEIELELLTNTDMLLMTEKRTRGRICHAIHRYAKANNKYMKNYDKSTTSSHFMYLDANNLYGWVMSRKLPVNGFPWVEELSEYNSIEFDESVIKNYDQDSNKGYFLELDVEYPKNLFNLHSDLPFLPERIKIGICNKLVCDFYDKKNYVVHIKALKQA